MIDYSLIYGFLVSLGIGALVGIERQKSLTDEFNVAGVRTFILIALLGTCSALLGESFSTALPIMLAAAVIILISLGYIRSSSNKNSLGLTTEISEVMVFAIGYMAYHLETRELAIMLGITTTILLAAKDKIHAFTHLLQKFELADTLKFCVITFIVLPLLPNETIDPWNVINPYNIWLMVVLISGLSYLGYVFVKVLGPDKGIGLTGFMGGLTSSTAVTTAMAEKCKENDELLRPAVFATMLASSVMFLRVLAQIAVVNSQVLASLLMPMASMFLVSIISSLFIWQRKTTIKTELKLSTPFALKPAITFAVFFMVILLLSHFAKTIFGEQGLYVVSIISGLADVDAITLSTAAMAAKGQIETAVAVKSITLAVISNTIMKLIYARLLGTKKFAQLIGIATALTIIAGIIAIII